MTDPTLPGTADAEGWRRLHPLSPLLRGGLALIVIAGIIIANFRDRLVEYFFADQLLQSGDFEGVYDEQDVIDYLVNESRLLLFLGIVIGIILLVVLFSWIAWRFHTYRITDEVVEARSGVIFRNHRRVPLERIQSVNLQRSLLARALGLTKIEVSTAGHEGKVELSYLGYRDAKTVREQILRRAAEQRAGVVAPHAPLDEIVAPASVGYDGHAYGPVNDKLTERVYDFADADIDPDAVAANTLVRVPLGRLLGSIALNWVTVIMVLAVIALAVFSVAFGPSILLSNIVLIIVAVSIVFTQLNRGFNFTLSRTNDAVRTGAGLTSTITESIPFGRIHAVEALQPLLWRPFGWWIVQVTIAGHSNSQEGKSISQNVVLPVGLEGDVLRVFEVFLPGIGDGVSETESLRDGLTGPANDYLKAGPKSAWVLLWGKRRAGFSIDGVNGEQLEHATLRIRRGALTRSLSVMPIVRAQSVQFRRPLLHRALGLASIRAHTVQGPVHMQMRGIELETAKRTFDELASTVLRVQAAEAGRRSRRD